MKTGNGGVIYIRGPHSKPQYIIAGQTINGAPGSFSVEFTLYSPDKSQSRTLTGVVDTRRISTLIPAPILDELGIARKGSRRFLMPDGSKRVLDEGGADIAIQGQPGYANLIFVDADSPITIGCLVLEGMALAADAGQKCLIPGEVFG